MINIFTILGNPYPHKRPRLTLHHVFDPNKKAKEYFRFSVIQQRESPAFFIGPLRVNITFYMPIPTSLSDKKRLELYEKPHIKKPDIDNLEKHVLDSCTGILYKDDSLIYSITSNKVYDDGQGPRTAFSIIEKVD